MVGKAPASTVKGCGTPIGNASDPSGYASELPSNGPKKMLEIWCFSRMCLQQNHVFHCLFQEKKWEFWCFTGEIYRFFTPGDLGFFMASRSKKDSSTSKNGASYLKNPKLANSIKKTSACSIVSQVRESDGIISNIHIYIYSYQLLLIVLSMQNRLDKDPWGPQSEGSWPWKSELHTSMVQNQGGRFGSPKTHGFFGEFQETSSIPNALHKGLMDYTNIYILYIVYCMYIYIYIHYVWV
jgi:hypothetical protein